MARHVYVHATGADTPVIWYTPTDIRFLHADQQGSIVAVSSLLYGNVVAVNAYDEYGIPRTGNVGRFQYTGQAWLAELGMYHYKARIYSPTLGRFLQNDPVGYGAGSTFTPMSGTIRSIYLTHPALLQLKILVLASAAWPVWAATSQWAIKTGPLRQGLLRQRHIELRSTQMKEVGERNRLQRKVWGMPGYGWKGFGVEG